MNVNNLLKNITRNKPSLLMVVLLIVLVVLALLSKRNISGGRY